jgi:putative acetyltransferase
VAQIPPDDREREPWPIVGHILLSPVTIEGEREPLGLGLAPLAVAPTHQRRGIGARLVEAALRRARLLGHAYVVVVGDSQYYSRFGFVPAARLGLALSGTLSPPTFLALELVPGALLNVSGVVHYHAAFADASGPA